MKIKYAKRLHILLCDDKLITFDKFFRNSNNTYRMLEFVTMNYFQKNYNFFVYKIILYIYNI